MKAEVGPEHLPALTWAMKAFSVNDLHPAAGLYAILTPEGVVWVGLTPWRLLGAQISPGDPSRGLAMHRFDHRKWTDPETEERFPSEVQDLKDILADGESVVIDFQQDVVSSLQTFIHVAVGSPAKAGDSIILPKARAKEWKDWEGKPREYVVRDDADGIRSFAPEHVVPFKGLPLRRVAPNVWAYYAEAKGITKFGLIAERKRIEPETPAEKIQTSVWK